MCRMNLNVLIVNSIGSLSMAVLLLLRWQWLPFIVRCERPRLAFLSRISRSHPYISALAKHITWWKCGLKNFVWKNFWLNGLNFQGWLGSSYAWGGFVWRLGKVVQKMTCFSFQLLTNPRMLHPSTCMLSVWVGIMRLWYGQFMNRHGMRY